MIQIEVNNVVVELKPQERQTFAQLMSTMLPGLVSGKKIIELFCSIIAEGSKRGIETTNPTFQATLWAMYQIGVRGVRINKETNNADLKTEKSSNFDKQPFESHFTMGNISTGRAMVASMILFTNRNIRVNQVMQFVVPQTMELMKPTNEAVMKSRLAGEEIHITAARYFVRMIEAGHTMDSAEVRCALQVLADLSVAAFSYSVENKTINIEGFNEANACALAYMQGMDADQIAQMHSRAAKANARMRGVPTPPIAMARRRRS
ncbi:MAG: hypothetical protein EXS12_01540 [Phycisphaerales bacterium]|nr:hypothetical protein [Phycisphaerales bacterium]